MKYKIPYSIILNARCFAKQVFEKRKGNQDKFKTGDELKADHMGFEVEFAHCYVFGLPFPKLFEGKRVDEFDCKMGVLDSTVSSLKKLKIMRFDIKTSKDFLINKKQFDYKKVDAYLFESIEFLDYSQGLIFLKLHGWIEKKDVPANSELIKFPNGSEAYSVKHLWNPKELFVIQEPEGILCT